MTLNPAMAVAQDKLFMEHPRERAGMSGCGGQGWNLGGGGENEELRVWMGREGKIKERGRVLERSSLGSRSQTGAAAFLHRHQRVEIPLDLQFKASLRMRRCSSGLQM